MRVNVKTVNGEELKITSRIKDAGIKINGTTYFMSPYICKEMSSNHIILGVDFITKYPLILVGLLQPKLKESRKGDKKGSIVGVLSKTDIDNKDINNILQNFNNLFADDLSNTEPCKIVKHKIITTESYPIAQKTSLYLSIWTKRLKMK